MADVAQLVRAPACDAGGWGFKSPHSPHFVKCLLILIPKPTFFKTTTRNMGNIAGATANKAARHKRIHIGIVTWIQGLTFETRMVRGISIGPENMDRPEYDYLAANLSRLGILI